MPKNTMKAIRLHEFGGPEVLICEEAPMPALQTGEVLVRVHAVGLNPPDWYLRDGCKSLPREWQPEGSFPIISGTDMSGTVAAVADDVTDFAAGDEVYSMVHFPEEVSATARPMPSTSASLQVGHKLTGIDHVHAAGAPMSLLTAWQFMIDLARHVRP